MTLLVNVAKEITLFKVRYSVGLSMLWHSSNAIQIAILGYKFGELKVAGLVCLQNVVKMQI